MFTTFVVYAAHAPAITLHVDDRRCDIRHIIYCTIIMLAVIKAYLISDHLRSQEYTANWAV